MIRIATMTAATCLATAAVAEDVTYDVEGVEHTGYFAGAEGEARGLVVVVHDWNGIDGYETGRADQLAGMGYDAFVIDMYGADNPTGSTEENRAATRAVTSDREAMRAIIAAGLDQAEDQSGAEAMVVMGYCFGGGVALEMARSDFADRAAGYTAFHGSLGTPDGQSYDGDEPPIQILHGAADESQTLNILFDLTRTLEEAGNSYTVEIYSGAQHAFTEPEGDRYQERAAEESWEAFSDFLEERLGA